LRKPRRNGAADDHRSPGRPAASGTGGAARRADRVIANAPLPVQASKRIANGIIDGHVAAEDGSWELSRAEGKALMRTADAAEGPRAFAEKRAPIWQAR
jgi:crotonobetainyl-CoA hydratase